MVTRIFNVAKMSWMLTWRLAIFSFIFFAGPHLNVIVPVAVVASAVIVFALNKTLVTWPLLKLLQRKPVTAPADSWGGQSAPAKPAYQPPKPRHGAASNHPSTFTPLRPDEPRLSSASEPGRITGFEPSTLSVHPVPSAFNMTGVPGSGLVSADDAFSGDSMSEEAVALGKAGEENFARALHVSGLLKRFPTTWSVPVPDQKRYVPADYDADIDCVLATGSTVFLVDLKNYKSGNVRYYAEGDTLICEDVPTGKIIGRPREMTTNMHSAHYALRTHLKDVNFVPVVVFMPTNKGEGIIDNVKWPGNIRAMNLTEFLAMLVDQPDFENGQPHSGSYYRLAYLLRRRDERRGGAATPTV